MLRSLLMQKVSARGRGVSGIGTTKRCNDVFATPSALLMLTLYQPLSFVVALAMTKTAFVAPAMGALVPMKFVRQYPSPVSSFVATKTTFVRQNGSSRFH